MTTNRRDEILTFAELEMRKGGFGAVSFRDIATAVDIKSASVHYHFPTKADLGCAVAERYADRFMSALGSPDDPTENRTDRLARLSNAYIAAYRQDSANCLCAVLGSVSAHLPEKIVHQVAVFYSRLSDWVETALEVVSDGMTARVIISLLQGAMTLATVTASDQPLMEAKEHLMMVVSPSQTAK